MTMVQWLLAGHLDRLMRQQFILLGLCRRMDVVEDRGDTGEAARPEDLLGVKRAIRPAKLRVAFPGYVAQFDVMSHYCTPWTLMTVWLTGPSPLRERGRGEGLTPPGSS